MDMLGDLFQLFYDVMTWGPDLGTQVELALGPLAIAGIALAGGAGLGAANYALGSKERNRLKDRAQSIDALRGESSQKLDEQIAGLMGEAETIDTDQSADELYGESIQALTDRVQGGQAQTGRQLSRGVMASGGDMTGSLNATLQKLTEQSNKSIQDIMNEYNERTDRRNVQNKRLQTNLMQSALSGRQSQMASLSNLSESAFNRSAQKATADKQFLMDSIGLGANVGSMFMGQGGGGG